MIALIGAGRGLKGRDDGGNVTNVRCKSNQNYHYESPHIMNKKKVNKRKKERKNPSQKRGGGVAQGVGLKFKSLQKKKKKKKSQRYS
jgi:hypothetical protein